MLKLKHEEEMDWKKQTEGLLQIKSEKNENYLYLLCKLEFKIDKCSAIHIGCKNIWNSNTKWINLFPRTSVYTSWIILFKGMTNLEFLIGKIVC